METNSAGETRLNGEQLKFYYQNGYIVVEDLINADELKGLRTRLREYTHGERPADKLGFQIEPRVTRGELEVGVKLANIVKVVELQRCDPIVEGLNHSCSQDPVSTIHSGNDLNPRELPGCFTENLGSAVGGAIVDNHPAGRKNRLSGHSANDRVEMPLLIPARSDQEITSGRFFHGGPF